MKTSLCFLILALFQNGYCTPSGALSVLGTAAGGGGGHSGASDCDGDQGGTGGSSGSGSSGGSGSGVPGDSGLLGGSVAPNVPSTSGGSGAPSVPGTSGGTGAPSVPGTSGGSGGSFTITPCANDNTDCSPITGLKYAQATKVAPGGEGTLALTAPQLAIVDKAKSELVHGAEAAVEAASHADVDKCLQLLLNAVDKVVVRAAQLIDSLLPGVGTAALQIYAAVSVAAHVAAKSVSTVAVGITGGPTGLLGGSLL